MILSKDILSSISSPDLDLPNLLNFETPEKVLQFGTGVLLRGLPDYFIDKANKAGMFNGRIVMVKSTTKGNLDNFIDQDNLYTICIRGVKGGKVIEDNIVSSAISRVLDANKQWDDVLKVAQSLELKLIISNTTEVGLVLHQEIIQDVVPESYPGKVLAVLFARYLALGSNSGKLAIIPTELIPNNGSVLHQIILELIAYNNIDDEFVTWLDRHVLFCNSLVDRIVPGKPAQGLLENIESGLGYKDELLIMAEPYCLWAIEGGQDVSDLIGLSGIDEGLIVKPDIEIYRELKVRLLNGSHTLASGIAFLAGFETVSEAMNDKQISHYIKQVMQQEIIPAIPYAVPLQDAQQFANEVLDRFSNPFIKHQWLSITFQYTMKLKIRVVPLLVQHYSIFNTIPQRIAFGIAAYLKFISTKEVNGVAYSITDDQLLYVNGLEKTDFVASILSDHKLWGMDLTAFEGFKVAVERYYSYITTNGIVAGLELVQ